MQILATSPAFVGPTSTTWREQVRTAIRSTEGLLKAVGLPPNHELYAEVGEFPTFAPLPFVQRMEPGNPTDPLLLQVLPTRWEQQTGEGYSNDPLHESNVGRSKGVLQKYSGRVLLIATGVCAIHCRYCFRRHFPYSAAPKSIDEWSAELAQIADDPALSEVILSGGDPLMLVDESLRELVARVRTMPQIRRLRIHTRLPIVIPQRVTPLLVETFLQYGKPVVVVLHSNHPQELDAEVLEACRQLRSAGNVTLLNQAVLLRGINDSVETLVALSQRLMEFGILPYYLHQLDRVNGSRHFEVSVDRGRELVSEMRAALPGYLVPRYVQELPGENAKTVLL